MSEDFLNPVADGVEPAFVPSPRVFVGATGNTTCRRSGGGYEEFFGGQVVCPTCQGAGRIPRETDQEFLALIPLSDKRLRPRRTLLYVILAVCLCLIIGGLLMFFYFPRSVNLSSNQPTLTPQHIYINLTQGILFMSITNEYNITNNNYFSIDVTSLDVVMNFDQRILATETNSTRISMPMRSSTRHFISMNATFTFNEDFIVQACKSLVHMTVMIPFRATVTLEYLGKTEQNTLMTYQYVRCNLGKSQSE